jgi:hypothetical protein
MTTPIDGAAVARERGMIFRNNKALASLQKLYDAEKQKAEYQNLRPNRETKAL